MSRQRGITIVDMVMVMFIITVITAIVTPSLAAIIRSQSDLSFRVGLESLAQKARAIAIREQRATSLTIDNEGRIGWDYAEDARTDDQANDEDNLGLGEVRDPLSFPQSTEFREFQLNSESVSQDEWQVKFFPDGTADQAVAEFAQNEFVHLFTIQSATGATKVTPGNIDDLEETRWEAGQIEQRITGQ
jgi:Tfp pilus assembly protein FimT